MSGRRFWRATGHLMEVPRGHISESLGLGYGEAAELSWTLLGVCAAHSFFSPCQGEAHISFQKMFFPFAHCHEHWAIFRGLPHHLSSSPNYKFLSENLQFSRLVGMFSVSTWDIEGQGVECRWGCQETFSSVRGMKTHPELMVSFWVDLPRHCLS